MPPTTPYSAGDVTVVNFLHTDESGYTRRPALVVSSNAYHRRRQEVIVMPITSNVDRVLLGDHLVAMWREAGLLHPSAVTGVIRTVKQGMVFRRIGKLHQDDLQAVAGSLDRMIALRREGVR